MDSTSGPEHFKGKDALGHVVEAQAKAIIASAEVHGVEVPGHLAAGADAARETSVLLPIIALLLTDQPEAYILGSLAIFSLGWLTWKTGRAAWLSWARLERLHRITAEERWEIENHRSQERSELKELYRAKGFQGKLLEDVLDVLMADNDRLLRVMVEEELGLSLNVHEHPLKQGLGAAVGVLAAGTLGVLGFALLSFNGVVAAGAIIMGVAAWLSAYLEKNKMIPAIVWNMGLGGLALSVVYFLLVLYTKSSSA